MSVIFASPLLLFGLIASAIPIIIHRLTHQRTIKKRFSAVRLLLRSQKVVARPQRLKHFLLLALRVTAIILLVLMASRPTLVRRGLLALDSGGPKVIIVDNSMSMGFRDARGERFAEASAAASAIVNHLKDPVAVIPTTATSQDGRAAAGTHGLKSPKDAAKELASLRLSWGKGDPGRALSEAFEVLARVRNASTGRKDIIIVSDLAKGDWEGVDPSRLGVIPADGQITVLRIGGAGRDSNAAIKEVKTDPGGFFAGSPSPLKVVASNLSGKEARFSVKAFVDDAAVDQKTVRLKAGEEGMVSFEIAVSRPGWHNAEIRISTGRVPVAGVSGDSLPAGALVTDPLSADDVSADRLSADDLPADRLSADDLPADRLSADDVFYVPLLVREKGRIGVVDGDPRVAMRDSESYYVARALVPDDSGRSPIQVQVIHEGELRQSDLSGYDMLFLLNVSQPPAAKVAAFVNAGKTLFMSLGDRTQAEDYHNIPLFPWRLRGLRDFGRNPEKVATVDYSHDALRQFGDTRGVSLTGASLSRSYRTEGGGRRMLTLTNGDPLLLESSYGRGKLYLFASSADLDWNDLPLAAGYVPLLQGLVKGALLASQPPIPPGVRVGESEVGGQPGLKEQAYGEETSGDQLSGQRGGPGIYRFPRKTGEVRRAVNGPFGESDLTKMTEGDLKKCLPDIALSVREYREGSVNTLHGSRRDLWPYLLGLMLLVLAAEVGVAQRI